MKTIISSLALVVAISVTALTAQAMGVGTSGNLTTGDIMTKAYTGR
jgi:hypothetical protein